VKEGISTFSEEDNEFMELCCFVVAGGIFALVSIMYAPGIYPSAEAEEFGAVLGSWCFVIGGLDTVIASYFNALKAGCTKFLSCNRLGLANSRSSNWIAGASGVDLNPHWPGRRPDATALRRVARLAGVLRKCTHFPWAPFS
jgi:hypothetical protein